MPKALLRRWVAKGSRQILYFYRMFYAYILKSTKDRKYYYGSTNDIDQRLLRHNRGLVASTKYRRPLNLHYVEKFELRKEAYKREMFFKSIDGYIWMTENKLFN